MHVEAHDYVARFRSDVELRVIEVGSRNINGSPRDLFPASDYVGVDVTEGRGVDTVADGATFKPKRKADVVVCCEVFEHCDTWRDIVWNVADKMLAQGGRFIVTAAGPSRQPHSAVDGGVLRDGEFYANVEPDDLALVLTEAGFSDVEVDVLGGDVRATGVLRRG